MSLCCQRRPSGRLVHSGVAQLAEQLTVNQRVVSSSLTPGAPRNPRHGGGFVVSGRTRSRRRSHPASHPRLRRRWAALVLVMGSKRERRPGAGELRVYVGEVEGEKKWVSRTFRGGERAASNALSELGDLVAARLAARVSVSTPSRICWMASWGHSSALAKFEAWPRGHTPQQRRAPERALAARRWMVAARSIRAELAGPATCILSHMVQAPAWVLPHPGTNGYVSSWGEVHAGAAPPTA